jgi:3-methylcrotonyl-CoA carboxylase alpha subunit/acetyl-CoA/propionyl-CoA carboxylase biotin carboxyl carrier protein
VEAPVTEATVLTSGVPLDLVALQLLVASGEPLPFGQGEVTQRGHAIEARVYAEDAFAGFLPQAGIAQRVRWPSGYDVQVHQSFESGQAVTTSYDPMLAKIVATGDDREDARAALVRALDETVVLGVTTNLGFLRSLAAGREFADAAIDTSWLDRNPDGVPRPGSDRAVLFAAVAAARTTPADPGHPFGISDGWRVAGPAAATLVSLGVDGETRRYRVGPDGSVGTAEAPDVELARVGPHATDDGDVPLVVLEIDGVLDRAHALVGPHTVEVSRGGQSHTFTLPDAFGPAGAADASDGSLQAPMPGTVLAVNVAEGDPVEAGQALGVIEAMKMELTLKAPFAGTVTKVGARTGDQVGLKQLLFTVEAVDVDA